MIFRLALAGVAMFAASKVGSGYAHLCHAGSRLLEGFAIVGSSLLCAAVVMLVRRYLVAIIIVVIYLTALGLLRRPYLDWVHGPHSPWPALL